MVQKKFRDLEWAWTNKYLIPKSNPINTMLYVYFYSKDNQAITFQIIFENSPKVGISNY